MSHEPRHYDHALLLMSQRKYDLAAQRFRDVIGQDPTNGHAFAQLSLCLANIPQLKSAEEAARRAVELAPDSDLSFYALAIVLIRRNKARDALAAAERCVELDPDDPMNWHAVGIIHLHENRNKLALDAAERGLSVDPSHLDLRGLRDTCLAKLGHTIAADEARATLAENPEDDQSHANLGWALLNQNKPGEAIDHFLEALRLDPTSHYAKSGLLEALKSRSWIYRPIFAYDQFLRRHTLMVQGWVVIGLFVALYGSRWLANNIPSTAPYMHLFRGALYALGFSLMFGQALINLILRFDPVGRRALTPRQSRFALALGCVVLPIILSFFMSAFSASPHWPRIRLILFPVCIVLVVLSDLSRRAPQRLANWFVAAIAVGAIPFAIHYFILPLGARPFLDYYMYAAFLGSLLIWAWDTFGTHDD